MSSLLVRSARPMLRSAVMLPATRMAQVVPARRLATGSSQSQSSQSSQPQQSENVWSKPVGAPIKEAASEAIADVKHAAETLKDGVKLKARQMQNNGSMEEMKNKAAELGVKAKRTMDSVSQQVGDMVDPAGAKGNKRQLHTSRSTAAATADRAATELAEDANRLKQKVQNRSTQVGAEIKEQGQSLLHSAKKTLRSVGDAVSDAVGGVANEVNPKGSSSTASKPVQQNEGSPELSTSKRSGNVLGGQGESSLGENMEGVKKSLFDGPQTMPQGVGERAVDAKGKPLETGAPRT